jgi:hypothetical protein
MILEVGLLKFPVWRTRWTKCKVLQGVGSLTIIVKLVASMLIGASGPLNQCVPVPALSNLTATALVFSWSWHRRIVCGAHDVLAKPIETVVDVIEIEGLISSVVFGDDSFTNEFLAALALGIKPRLGVLRGSVGHGCPSRNRCCAQYPMEI